MCTIQDDISIMRGIFICCCYELFILMNCDICNKNKLYFTIKFSFLQNTICIPICLLQLLVIGGILWMSQPESGGFIHHCDFPYLAYRTGQSVDLTVIGNPVFTLSRDLSFPYHMINRTKVVNGTYFSFCRLQYMSIQYQVSNWTFFWLIGNPSCHRFYPLLVLESIRTQVLMTSLYDVKRPLPIHNK